MDTQTSPTKSFRKKVDSGKRAQGPNEQGGSTNQTPVGKLRGSNRDSPEVRMSKTLSWLLRHAATGEGLPIRSDGYIKVTDLLANPKIKSQALGLAGLQEIVKADSKQRFDLVSESDVWWVRARQGHSIKAVNELGVSPILSAVDIATGVAVHGTTTEAWESISKEGLSKMKRNHIHMAQGVPGSGVISGMRNSSQIFIFINVRKAIDAGIKFSLSHNGVILTEGNEVGILGTEFFLRVEDANKVALPGWEGTEAP